MEAPTAWRYGQHPVQAEGRIERYPFYFRAKWDFWTFTVCLTNDNIEIPSCMNPQEDKPGFFHDLQQRGYYLSEYFGKETDAGKMPLQVAAGIIRNCAAEFRQAMQSRGKD